MRLTAVVLHTVSAVFPAGAIPGEEPSPYVHPEAQRLPGSSCNQEGKVDVFPLLAVVASSGAGRVLHQTFFFQRSRQTSAGDHQQERTKGKESLQQVPLMATDVVSSHCSE